MPERNIDHSAHQDRHRQNLMSHDHRISCLEKVVMMLNKKLDCLLDHLGLEVVLDPPKQATYRVATKPNDK